MTPYRAGWRALAAVMVMMLCWVAAAVAFVRPYNFGLFVGLSLLLWLPTTVILGFFPRCPTCRTSVFVKYKSRWVGVAWAWPSRSCCACGAKLDKA